MTTPLRIAFAGTPEFAWPALNALHQARHTIVGVWTQPDRPAGRGRKLTASPIKHRALELGLPLYQPETLKRPEAQAAIQSLAPQVIVVVAYGLLLPPAVLAIPEHGCLNIHASLLPRWRGAAPIQRALLAGDAETGISIMRMDKGLDTGPVLAARATPIRADDTGGSLHDRLAKMGAELLVETLGQLSQLRPVPQDAARASHAAKLSHAEAELDWRRPAAELERAVRAYNPWPVAFTFYKGEPLRIWRAAARAGGTPAVPGTVMAADREGLEVATGEGRLHLSEVQPAGKRVMSAADFARARDLGGVRLGR